MLQQVMDPSQGPQHMEFLGQDGLEAPAPQRADFIFRRGTKLQSASEPRLLAPAREDCLAGDRRGRENLRHQVVVAPNPTLTDATR